MIHLAPHGIRQPMPIVLPSQLDRLEDHEIPKEFDPVAIEEFVTETRRSGGGELANAQTI